LVPKLKPFLHDYAAALDPEEKRFIAVYTWLKFPGLEPIVGSGVGRTAALEEQDVYRDNWWCGAVLNTSGQEQVETKTNRAPAFAVDPKPAAPQFLTPAQRAAAQREAARIAAADAAPNYLVRQ